MVVVEMMLFDGCVEISVSVLNSSLITSRNCLCTLGEESAAFLLVFVCFFDGLFNFFGDAMANDIFCFLCGVSVVLIPAKLLQRNNLFGDYHQLSLNAY